MKGIPDPPFRSFPEGPWVASGSRPPPSPTDFYDQDRLCPAVASEVFDVGVSVSFSSSSFPCLPLSLKFGWIWQRREVHTASILDGPGAATPAVLVRTSHRHLGALPCWGEGGVCPSEEQRNWIDASDKAGEWREVEQSYPGRRAWTRAMLRASDLMSRGFSSALGERTKSQGQGTR